MTMLEEISQKEKEDKRLLLGNKKSIEKVISNQKM
jgi:hypothetical protein